MAVLTFRRSFLSRLLNWLTKLVSAAPEVAQEKVAATIVAPSIEVISITEFRTKLVARPRGGGHDHMYH